MSLVPTLTSATDGGRERNYRVSLLAGRDDVKARLCLLTWAWVAFSGRQ